MSNTTIIDSRIKDQQYVNVVDAHEYGHHQCLTDDLLAARRYSRPNRRHWRNARPLAYAWHLNGWSKPACSDARRAVNLRRFSE